MVHDPLQNLQTCLGYHFKNTLLLERALTHSSTGAEKNYERLEFLGDRVIGLVIAHILWETFPDEAEGDLAKRHAALVQGETLAQLARLVELGDAMQISGAERLSGGAENDNILADGLESVLGAMFIDGGLENCERVIKKLWADILHIMKSPPQDSKTALQEWAQARGLGLPDYKVVSKEGPDHAPVFEISVTIEGYPSKSMKGTSRRKAEKEAASLMLAYLIETEHS